MVKERVLVLILILVLSGCSGSPLVKTPTPTITGAQAPTPMAVPTRVPTPTPEPTATLSPTPTGTPIPNLAVTRSPEEVVEIGELQRLISRMVLTQTDLGLSGYWSKSIPASIPEGAIYAYGWVILASNPSPTDPWQGAFLRELIYLYSDIEVARRAFTALKPEATQLLYENFGPGQESYQAYLTGAVFRRANLLISIVTFSPSYGDPKEYAKLADAKITAAIRLMTR